MLADQKTLISSWTYLHTDKKLTLLTSWTSLQTRNKLFVLKNIWRKNKQLVSYIPTYKSGKKTRKKYVCIWHLNKMYVSEFLDFFQTSVLASVFQEIPTFWITVNPLTLNPSMPEPCDHFLVQNGQPFLGTVTIMVISNRICLLLDPEVWYMFWIAYCSGYTLCKKHNNCIPLWLHLFSIKSLAWIKKKLKNKHSMNPNALG